MGRKISVSLLTAILMAIALIFSSAFLLLKANIAVAQTTASSSPSLPVVTYADGERQVRVPDWSQVSFSSFPAIASPGKIEFSPDLVGRLGYNPSRSWSAGARIEQVLQLGDVSDNFRLEALNLNDITNLTGLAQRTLNLKDFELMQWQTPASLLRAVPQLKRLQIQQVPPLRDLLTLAGGKKVTTVAEAVQRNVDFARLPLGKLELSKYKIQAIPGLNQVAVGRFKAWQQSPIASVPGLNQVPLAKFPLSPFGFSGLSLAQSSLPLGAAERGDASVPPDLYISGTVNKKDQTVPVPCEAEKPCSYLELSDFIGINGSQYGKRWVSGKSQKVKGGFGPLAAFNNGWEPTGKLVFGSAFKVVLTDIDESTGIADFALYFRACVSPPFIGKTCTPYAIGGLPWFPVREKGVVVVASTASPDVDVPTKYREQIDEIEVANSPPPTSSAARPATTQSSPPGETNSNIMAAINQTGAFSTANVPGTSGGKNACMWAVNNVLKDAGYEPLADDTLAVRQGQAALENGRGQKINIAEAKPGDIVLVDNGGSRQHIGFCTNNGCTQTISNSSSRASFSFRGNSNFSYPNSPYNGSTPQVYRLKK